ncbi:Probable V-type proton ATPase subunit H [Galdieria sulphuraria]|nr:Probable V-type proton ATPase subunit H [Galdieria sulphuraria]
MDEDLRYPWMELARSHLLQKSEAELLQSCEQNLSEEREGFLDKNCRSVVGAILSVLSLSSNVNEQQRAANLFLSLLTSRKSLRLEEAIVAVAKQDSKRNLFQPLITFLEKENRALAASCAQILAILFSVDSTYKLEPLDLVKKQCSHIADWFGNNLLENDSTDEGFLLTILSSLCQFVRHDNSRLAFAEKGKDNVKNLSYLLEKNKQEPVSIIYKTLFVLWMLSFAHSAEVKQVVAESLEKIFISRHILEVLKYFTMEKVIRVTLSFTRNLAAGSLGQRIRRELIGAGVLEQVVILSSKGWSDKDIVDDINAIQSCLEEERKVMNSFELYREEVLSGALNWTPVHKDPVFWSENVQKLDKNNFEVVEMLVRLVEETHSSVVASIACHDLAMYMKYHPSGRLHIQRYHVKDRLMELMVTGEPEVKKEALKCIQMLFLHRWDFEEKS